MTCLDTHIAIWLCTGEVPLSDAALREIDTCEIRISPMVLFELKMLQEIGRLNAAPADWLVILQRDFSVTVCPLAFHQIIGASFSESWTRDPFDRLIVAHAKLAGGRLISRVDLLGRSAGLIFKDRRIRDHFPDVIW